jgi:hypothetical protein
MRGALTLCFRDSVSFAVDQAARLHLKWMEGLHVAHAALVAYE